MMPSVQADSARTSVALPKARCYPYLQYDDQRDERRRQLVALVECFYTQIRYGCQEPACTVPTCRTCRDRLVKSVPYRVPTPLTARAIASYLASLDDPYRHLCRHPPLPKPDKRDRAFATLEVLNRAFKKEQDSAVWAGHLEHSLVRGAGRPSKKILEADGDFRQTSASTTLHNSLHDEEESNFVESPEVKNTSEPPIDPKSFSQKLFSTVTWRLCSFTEIYLGKYRLLPPWTDDHLTPILKAFANLDVSSSVPVKPNKPFIETVSLHPRIGVFSYSVPPTPALATVWNPYALSNFGQLLFGRFPHRRVPKRDVRNLGRTCPIGGHCFLGVLDVANERNALLRSIANVLGSPSEIQKYGMDLRFSKFFPNSEPKEVPIAVLVQELLVLLDFEQHPRTVLMSLALCVQATYIDPRLPNSSKTIPVADAAHIFNVTLAALVARAVKNQGKELKQESWKLFSDGRKKGQFLSINNHSLPVRKSVAEYMLSYQDEQALHLARIVFRSLASWNYQSTSPLEDGEDSPQGISRFQSKPTVFRTRIVQFLETATRQQKPPRRSLLCKFLLEWARMVFLQDWNGEPEFSWSSDAGCAIDFMWFLYQNRFALGLGPEDFAMRILFQRTDFVEMPKAWMTFIPTTRTGHLLSFPWLFTPSSIITFFRAINFSVMFKSYERSTMVDGLMGRMAWYVNGARRKLFDKLRVSTTTFLVLEIRRDNLLRDALNQLWRRQKRELLRPLKVRMGMDEGEEGFDLGGVQQEFFRLAVAEALDPVHGLFSVDEVTRMTWFLPGSQAPLYQYVLIGLLFGLAVYNGLTLPVTFPIALYRKLLELPVNILSHITDGWPALTRGFVQLLKYHGSVEDVFMRQYTFSFVSQGMNHDVDMQKYKRGDPWPQQDVSAPEDHFESVKSFEDMSSAFTSQNFDVVDGAASDRSAENKVTQADEAAMVTNENRSRYVWDYIYWLTDKSIAPQFSAFATGFYLPLQKKSLRLFTPEALRALVEGIQQIDIDGLQRTTEYEDGYSAQHPTIVDFWNIVKSYSPEEARLLLEFVTASDRVPVRGIQEMTFIVQRNGVGDERLPSSATCFGRLLLPEYSSKEIMAQRLRLAIANNRGFGYQ